MGKVIVIDGSGLFVPAVKVYNKLLKTAVDKNKKRLIEEFGNVDGWTYMDFLSILKERKELPFIMMPHVMYFNSLISCLKKIGVKEDDTVIMALEGHSWRKDFDADYKAQREGLRDADECVNWDFEFKRCNKLHDQLNEATNWHFVRVPNYAEADDICAVSARYFKDKEVIIVTGDKDLHQLLYYENVKILNTNKKINGSKGVYETSVKNPLKIISDKVRLGDKSDNIIPQKIEVEEDYLHREEIITLLKLPEYVEKAIIKEFENLESKKENLNLLPNFKNVKEKFLKIYDKEKILTYDYCVKLQEKRELKKSEKAKQKKKEKINGKS